MTPNEYLNEILTKQDELAARCRQNPRGLREALPKLAELQTRLRSLEALPAGPDRPDRITELFQDFAVLMEDVEQCYGVLPSALGGTMHAPVRDYDTRRFWETLDLIRNIFQQADVLLGSPGQGTPAGAASPRPGSTQGNAQDTLEKKDQE